MRRSAFLIYLLIQLAVVMSVTAIFKIISDRQTAATMAGFLFVGVPALLMVLEYRRARLSEFVWFVVVLQFWTMFALPILGMRLLNWGVSFETLSFFGIPGPVLHQWSSKSYMIMMAFTAWIWWKHRNLSEGEE